MFSIACWCILWLWLLQNTNRKPIIHRWHFRNIQWVVQQHLDLQHLHGIPLPVKLLLMRLKKSLQMKLVECQCQSSDKQTCEELVQFLVIPSISKEG